MAAATAHPPHGPTSGPSAAKGRNARLRVRSERGAGALRVADASRSLANLVEQRLLQCVCAADSGEVGVWRRAMRRRAAARRTGLDIRGRMSGDDRRKEHPENSAATSGVEPVEVAARSPGCGVLAIHTQRIENVPPRDQTPRGLVRVFISVSGGRGSNRPPHREHAVVDGFAGRKTTSRTFFR